MKIVSEKVTVLDKKTKDITKDGVTTTYFNVSVGGMGFSHNLGVPKEVYDAVEVGQDIYLEGQLGFKRTGERFWFFDRLHSGK